MIKYILRFDDITPSMNWSKFSKLEKTCLDAGVLPILGVVPDNKDPKLNIGKAISNFWERIRWYQERDWSIAQHGFNHLYDTNCGGILGLNNKSEFSGHPFEIQYKKLDSGKRILESEGIKSTIFMAPSHSFDNTTIQALIECGFDMVTDGFSLYPYDQDGLTFIPQLFATPKNIGFGIYTICLHTNTMKDKEAKKLCSFISRNKEKFISVTDARDFRRNDLFNTRIIPAAYKALRAGMKFF